MNNSLHATSDLHEPLLGDNLPAHPSIDICLLLDLHISLNEDHLNVSGVTHVGTDASVRSVGPSASPGGAVALDVLDLKLVNIKALGLGVGLGILKKVQHNLSGLDRPPSAVSGGIVLLSLGGVPNSSSETGESHCGLHINNILQVLLAPGNILILDHLADITAVLEVHTKVRPSRPTGLGGVSGLSGIADHC